MLSWLQRSNKTYILLFSSITDSIIWNLWMA